MTVNCIMRLACELQVTQYLWKQVFCYGRRNRRLQKLLFESLSWATSTARLSCERRGAEQWACYWLPPHRDDTTIGQCASESDETLLPRGTLRKLITHYEIGRPQSLRTYLPSRFITPTPPNLKVFLIAFRKRNLPHFRCDYM